MSEYPEWMIPTQLDVCVRSGTHGGHTTIRPTLPGTDLCGPCHGRFPRILTDLVDYWPLLTAGITRQPTHDYASDRVDSSNLADAGSLWNPAAAKAQADIADWVRYLTRTLHTDHPGTPVITATTRTNVALAAIARWYARWFTHYPTIGPAVLEDALQLRSQAMKALEGPSFKRITIQDHYCQDVIEDTEYGPVLCGGQLVGLIRREDSARPSMIVCSLNPGHTRLDRKGWILAD